MIMNGVLNIKKIFTIALQIVLLLIVCEGYTRIQNYNRYLCLLVGILVIGLFLCKEDKVISGRNKNPFIILVSLYLVFDFFVINENKNALLIYYIVIWAFSAVLLLDLDDHFFDVLIKCVYYFTIIEMVSVLLELVTGHASIMLFSSLYSRNVYESMLQQALRGYYIGIVGEKAIAAFWLIIGLSMFLAKNIKKNEPIKLKTIIGTALFLFCIFLTAKRTIIVFAVVLIASQFLLVNYSKKTITIFCVVIAAMIGLYLMYKYVPAVQLMIERFGNSSEDLETMNSRTALWDRAREMFKAKPIFGWGRGSFHLGSLNGMEGHNVYLQNFAENGIVGGCLWILTYISGLGTLVFLYFKTQDGLVKILMFSQLLILLYGMTENILFTSSLVGYYCMTFIGLSYVIKKYRESVL